MYRLNEDETETVIPPNESGIKRAKWDKVIAASNSNNENIVTGSAYFYFLKYNSNMCITIVCYYCFYK